MSLIIWRAVARLAEIGVKSYSDYAKNREASAEEERFNRMSPSQREEAKLEKLREAARAEEQRKQFEREAILRDIQSRKEANILQLKIVFGFIILAMILLTLKSCGLIT